MPPWVADDDSSGTEEEIFESPPRKPSTSAELDERDNLTCDSEGSSSTSTPPTSIKHSTLTPKRLVTRSTPRLEKGLDTDNILDTPPTKVKHKIPNPRESSGSPLLKRRKTRALSKGNQQVNYDMKYHPMDEITRPAQAARHALQFPGAKATPSMKKRRISHRYTNDSMIDKEKSPKPEDAENPFTQPIPSDWHDFNDYDRRVYVLQKGAPVDGGTLPIKWPLLVNVLVGEDYFSKQQLKAWGGLQVLKDRYEKVRVSLQSFWKAGEEAKSSKNFALMPAEDFDVYDLFGSTRKYRHRDRAVDTSMKTPNAEHPEKEPLDEEDRNLDDEESQSETLASDGSEMAVDPDREKEYISNELREVLMPFIDEATLDDNEDVLRNEDLRQERKTSGFTALNHEAMNAQPPPLSADRQFELDLSKALAKESAAHDRKLAEKAALISSKNPGHGALLGYQTVYNEFVHSGEPATYDGRYEPPMNPRKRQYQSRKGRPRIFSGEFDVYEDSRPSPKEIRSTREQATNEDDSKENHDSENESENEQETPQEADNVETPPRVSQVETSQSVNDSPEDLLPVIPTPNRVGTSDDVPSPSTVGTLTYDDQNKVFMTPRSTKIEYFTPRRSLRSPSMPGESPATTRTELLDMFGAKSSEQQIAEQKAKRGSNLVTQFLDTNGQRQTPTSKNPFV
ncbi:MAG: hypothetical protein M1835_004000 [Candelina submexicana]|nr:MAG: hypothetical protein M1835_004000 [Candelina submexicana]